MNNLIFLIANQYRALFYSKPLGGNKVTLLSSITNESGKMRRHDLVTEHTNITHAGPMGYPHPTDKENQPRIHDLEMFAKLCSGKMKGLLETEPDSAVVLICSPKMLGIIRPNLNRMITEKVIYEIPKEINCDEEGYVAEFLIGKAL